MKTVSIIFFFFIGAALTIAEIPNCGPLPAKRPIDCCEGLDKFIKREFYDECDKECSPMDMCCKGNCFSMKLGILKDGAFDKETALKSLDDTFADPTWKAIYTKGLDECVARVASMKEQLTPPPNAPKCDNVENGLIAFCLKKNLFMNCPMPSNDEECEQTRTFLNCVLP
ncbi:CLUMA_CG018049, isoform A [Clunio marinus]|uniref:CLUMA_CG018049, isoform A n=1 Tax=Clunio marinus TaxID=568069 RepID=A0A1J1IZ39_9DIPT|nr:CLUMA_CG018049, isoform A [Clunio marinus]